MGFIKINSTWFYVLILRHLVQTKAIKQKANEQATTKTTTKRSEQKFPLHPPPTPEFFSNHRL